MRRCYVALGDSMSIDLYPRLELQERGRLEPDDSAGVGAASLLHRNHDSLWPEFRGCDLRGAHPDIEQCDHCVDGATIGQTLAVQLPGVSRATRAAASVVTVTAGGNDLLEGLFGAVDGLERATESAIRRYGQLVDAVLEAFPDATVVLATVYDPTDGTGHLPGVSEHLGVLPLEHLEAFNGAVREVAASRERTALADVHAHFLGHGVSAPTAEQWYWAPSPIEPGARGASEIRRLWLEALGR